MNLNQSSVSYTSSVNGTDVVKQNVLAFEVLFKCFAFKKNVLRVPVVDNMLTNLAKIKGFQCCKTNRFFQKSMSMEHP